METETETAAAFTYKEKWAIELTRANALERQILMASPERTEAEESFIQQLKTATSDNRTLLARVWELEEQNKHFLTEIIDLHREYQKTDCPGCDGKGWTVETQLCDYPSRLDPMTPAEEEVDVTCEDCCGSGKEWGV